MFTSYHYASIRSVPKVVGHSIRNKKAFVAGFSGGKTEVEIYRTNSPYVTKTI